MSRSTTVDTADGRAAGFQILGEPIALDLVNTQKRASVPFVDLIAGDERNSTFWGLESARLPAGPTPDLADVVRLRSAIQELVDNRMRDENPDAAASDTVNYFAGAAHASPALEAVDGDWVSREEWTRDAALAITARSAIDLLTGPEAARLRECAARDCSMVFVATNSKRIWCVAEICGNRERVARFAKKNA